MPESLVLKFLDRSRGCKDLQELGGVVQGIFAEVGLPLWAYQTPSVNPDIKQPVILHNFPAAWEAHYIRNNYSRVDPVIVHGQHHTKPFQWSGLLERVELKPEQKAYYAEATEAGLRDGLAIPLISPKGCSSIVSLAGDEVPKELSKILQEHQSDLIAIAFAFHAMVGEMIRGKGVRESNLLRLREKECLLWVMKGKTSDEIAIILGLSVSGVNFHITNAMHKLDVVTRIQAVAKAILEGHIFP